jgi:hypothetical protein
MAIGRWVSEGQIEFGSEAVILGVLFSLFSGKLGMIERRKIESAGDGPSFRC